MISQLESIIRNPDLLINGDDDLANLFLEMSSSFFEMTKQNEYREGSGGKIEQLKTKGFGQFSIWEQIRLQNEALIGSFNKFGFPKIEVQDIEEPIAGEEDMIEQMEEDMIEEEDIVEYDEDGIQNAHISDENLNEEEEVEEEEKMDPAHMTYKDFFGDEPPEDSDNEMKNQIEKIEKSLIEPKPWHQMGESKASERPKDSLADIDIDFDVNTTLPPDPLPTKELEDLLRRRIESMRFDDVVRVKKSTQNTHETFQINGVKSNKSLVEIYAEDILKGENNAEQETKLTPEQREALEMWSSLEQEINRFTERRFVPRRPKEKVDISAGAVLDVESRPEPGQTPEEIMKHAGNTKQMKSELEKTHQEKKSERKTRKEHDQKKRIEKDAEKGVLYSQSGKDGLDLGIQKEIQKLAKGELSGIETYAPGEAIPEQEQKKNFKKNYLL